MACGTHAHQVHSFSYSLLVSLFFIDTISNPSRKARSGSRPRPALRKKIAGLPGKQAGSGRLGQLRFQRSRLAEIAALLRPAAMGAIAANIALIGHSVAYRRRRRDGVSRQGPVVSGRRSQPHGRAFINSQTAQSASDPLGVRIASAQHARSGYQQAETDGDQRLDGIRPPHSRSC